MEKRDLIVKGKAKSMYTTDDAGYCIMHFRDDTSAFDGKKVEQLERKGRVNNIFNAFIMEKLQAAGIPTHFVKRIDDRDSLVRRMTMIPVECVVRNVVAGSPNTFSVRVADVEFLGSFCRVGLAIDGAKPALLADFSINVVRDLAIAEGKEMPITLPADRLRVFPRAPQEP